MKIENLESPDSGTTLGQWVKKRRLEMGLSLRRFSEAAGIAHTTIASVEKGGQARGDTLHLIVQAFANHEPFGLSYEEVMREARAASAGIESPASTPEAQELTAAILAATPERRAIIRALLEDWAAGKDTGL